MLKKWDTKHRINFVTGFAIGSFSMLTICLLLLLSK